MLDRIMNLKADVIERLEKLVDERGLERMDAKELVDAVKDLSEAEYNCSVVDAMGYDGRMGRSGYRDSMGRYSTRANRRRGYRMGHMDAIENLREEMQSASAEEREQLKQALRQMLGM